MEFLNDLTGSLFWATALSLLFYGAASPLCAPGRLDAEREWLNASALERRKKDESGKIFSKTKRLFRICQIVVQNPSPLSVLLHFPAVMRTGSPAKKPCNTILS
jgi:hypothetical protein